MRSRASISIRAYKRTRARAAADTLDTVEDSRQWAHGRCRSLGSASDCVLSKSAPDDAIGVTALDEQDAKSRRDLQPSFAGHPFRTRERLDQAVETSTENRFPAAERSEAAAAANGFGSRLQASWYRSRAFGIGGGGLWDRRPSDRAAFGRGPG